MTCKVIRGLWIVAGYAEADLDVTTHREKMEDRQTFDDAYRAIEWISAIWRWHRRRHTNCPMNRPEKERSESA